MKTVSIDNQKIAYKEAGTGETIVLLHGFCGSTEYWQKVVQPLQEKYHIVLMDLRGHGESTFNGESFDLEDLANDVNQLLNELNIEKVYLFGHSLGGYVTLSFAEKYADKLLGFGLIHSTAFTDTEEAKEGRLKSIEKIQDMGIEEFVNGMIPNLFSDHYMNTNEEEVSRIVSIGYDTNPIAAMETLSAMRKRPDRNEVIANSNLPILIVKGKFDKVVPLNRVITSNEENITTAVLETGHMSMIEAPGELISTIIAFIKGK